MDKSWPGTKTLDSRSLVCRFELAAPPRFGLVCLRLRGVGNDGNRALLAAVNHAGEPPPWHCSASCTEPSHARHNPGDCIAYQRIAIISRMQACHSHHAPVCGIRLAVFCWACVTHTDNTTRPARMSDCVLLLH